MFFRDLTKRAAGASVAEAAGYANLPAGSGGDLALDTATGIIYKYNALLSLWMPTNVQPTALILEYDGVALPTASTPAWTKEGGSAAAVAAGVLTITDGASDYGAFNITDADIASTSNIGIIVRAKVNSRAGGADGYRAMIGIRPGALNGAALSIAGGAGALSSVNQIFPISMSSGAALGGYPTYSSDNAVYQNYYIFFFKDTKKFKMGVLGDLLNEFALDNSAFDTSYIAASSVLVGCFSTSAECTLEVDHVKVFSF